MKEHYIHVESIQDHEDGSATISFEVGIEALKLFASIGIQQVLLESAKGVIDGRSDTKGSGDGGAGEDGDPPVHGEFPGF